jgi:transposase
MKKRRNHDVGFKARVALEAVKGERTVSELAAEYGVHPTMMHQWKKALLDCAVGIFERGGRRGPEIDEETVRSLHAEIGKLAVANDFLSSMVRAPIGCRMAMNTQANGSMAKCGGRSAPSFPTAPSMRVNSLPGVRMGRARSPIPMAPPMRGNGSRGVSKAAARRSIPMG